MSRYLITSALPYINGVKHLGNLVGSMLPADVYSRYQRQRGHEVLYVCATDEHGTPAEIAAQQAGQSVEDYCREQHELQREVCAGFNLSFDVFGRSSSHQNRTLTQHFASVLERNGFIEERIVNEVYSPADGRFLPDRYIVGTCPNCNYEAARGDQCESCAKLLDPGDLIAPRSVLSGSRDLELRETRHLYLLLSELAGEVEAWLAEHQDWPILVRSIAEKWLREGLKDRAITRDLKWGVPVGRPGFESKVFYVWFDAPIEYIGATWELADETDQDYAWRRWWYDRDDVYHVQFMAKDNVPFHSIWWPAVLIGSREPWELADYIKSFNWLNYYRGKFSTSSRRGVFMDAALELLPSDYWRFALLSNAPESDDVEFTWEAFALSVNKELADNFGNLVQRILAFNEKHFASKVPPFGACTGFEEELVAQLSARLTEYEQAMQKIEFRRAARALESIWATANRYWAGVAPWRVMKVDRSRAGHIVAVGLNLLRILALLSCPWIPTSARTLLKGLGEESLGWVSASNLRTELASLPPGRQIGAVPILFRKVTAEELEAWKTRFAGVETDRASEPSAGVGH